MNKKKKIVFSILIIIAIISAFAATTFTLWPDSNGKTYNFSTSTKTNITAPYKDSYININDASYTYTIYIEESDTIRYTAVGTYKEENNNYLLTPQSSFGTTPITYIKINDDNTLTVIYGGAAIDLIFK